MLKTKEACGAEAVFGRNISGEQFDIFKKISIFFKQRAQFRLFQGGKVFLFGYDEVGLKEGYAGPNEADENSHLRRAPLAFPPGKPFTDTFEDNGNGTFAGCDNAIYPGGELKIRAWEAEYGRKGRQAMLRAGSTLHSDNSLNTTISFLS